MGRRYLGEEEEKETDDTATSRNSLDRITPQPPTAFFIPSQSNLSDAESSTAQIPLKKKPEIQNNQIFLTDTTVSSEGSNTEELEEITTMVKCFHCNIAKTIRREEGLRLGPSTLCHTCTMRLRQIKLHDTVDSNSITTSGAVRVLAPVSNSSS